MQADWATVGRGVERLSVFIATLGWSRATYVEFCDDERVESLIRCHENACLVIERARLQALPAAYGGRSARSLASAPAKAMLGYQHPLAVYDALLAQAVA